MRASAWRLASAWRRVRSPHAHRRRPVREDSKPRVHFAGNTKARQHGREVDPGRCALRIGEIDFGGRQQCGPERTLRADVRQGPARAYANAGRDVSQLGPGTGHEMAVFLEVADHRRRHDHRVAALAAEEFPNVPLKSPLEGNQTLLSIEKARRVLGFEPEHSWRDEL